MTDDATAKKLWDLICGIKIAMLSTVEDGVPRSRPVTCAKIDQRGVLWFFARRPALDGDGAASRWPVNLSFADIASQNYVSVSGSAVVVDDRDQVSELWSEEQSIFFPKGVDDPDLALLRVRVQEAEYWDSPSSETVGGFGLVKAIVDETPDVTENRKLVFEAAS